MDEDTKATIWQMLDDSGVISGAWTGSTYIELPEEVQSRLLPVFTYLYDHGMGMR